MVSLKSEIQNLKAENGRIKPLEEDLSKLRLDRANLQKSYSDLQTNIHMNEQTINDLSARINQLDKDNQSLRTDLKTSQARQAKLIEDQKAALQSNLSDIENLKTNFETYLESLVQTFNERNKKS